MVSINCLCGQLRLSPNMPLSPLIELHLLAYQESKDRKSGIRICFTMAFISSVSKFY